MVTAAVLGGTAFQTTGCTANEINEFAAGITAGLVSSIVNQFIAAAVADAFGVPTTGSLMGLFGI